MKAYKAFEKGLICRGHKFNLEGVNITEAANCVHNGWHCAENPLDCLTYYPNMKTSEYYIVNATGDIDEDGRDSKISCTHLEIVKKLSVAELVKEAVIYIINHPHRADTNRTARNTGSCEEEFLIVRGKDPAVSGKCGSVLALIKEPKKGIITEARIFKIDGKHYLPDCVYKISDEGIVERVDDFEKEKDRSAAGAGRKEKRKYNCGRAVR